MAYGNDDLVAFETLYQRHKSRVFGYILSKLKNRSEAEEVFQTTFTKLHLARSKYRTEIPFLPWLFTIIRNTLIDHQRKATTYQNYLNTAEQFEAGRDEPLEEDQTAGLRPEILLELPDIQRQALELRFSQGLTFKEIAAQMQTSDDNSRQIISRAVRKLRDLLANKEQP